VCVAIALVALVPRGASAQGVLERLNLDRLQLVSLGASAGPIRPSQVVSTTIYAVGADYGEITRGIRIVFGVSYWRSQYTDRVVEDFAATLERNIVNGTAITRIVPSRISLFDVTFNTEFRWMRPSATALKPFLGLGVSAHVMNAEGDLIEGTFMETSLDNIASGVFLTAGLQLRPVSHFGLEGALRGDLLSGVRSLQARGGANYYFGHLRSTTP
jgi:hypothetical protein